MKNLKADDLQEETGIKAVRSFHMYSTHCLQFVCTKTFLNLLTTFSQTFQVQAATTTTNNSKPNNKKSSTHIDSALMDEYQQLKKEEETFLLETSTTPATTAAEKEEEDEDEESAISSSFNFMIKNELGADVLIEPLAGFQFLNSTN